MPRAKDKHQSSPYRGIYGWLHRAASGLYRISFEWWLDIPQARRAEARFRHEIRENLSFLFDDEGATIVPNEDAPFPPPFDYALVTVAVGQILFRFVRGRREFRIDMAVLGSVKSWRDWKDLRLIWAVLTESEINDHILFLRSLSDADRFLRAELPRLQNLASDEQWNLVRRKVNALYPLPIRMR